MNSQTIDMSTDERPFSAENDKQNRPFSPGFLRDFLFSYNEGNIPPAKGGFSQRRNLVSEGLRYRSLKRSKKNDMQKTIFNNSTRPSLNDVFSSKYCFKNKFLVLKFKHIFNFVKYCHICLSSKTFNPF